MTGQLRRFYRAARNVIRHLVGLDALYSPEEIYCLLQDWPEEDMATLTGRQINEVLALIEQLPDGERPDWHRVALHWLLGQLQHFPGPCTSALVLQEYVRLQQDGLWPYPGRIAVKDCVSETAWDTLPEKRL